MKPNNKWYGQKLHHKQKYKMVRQSEIYKIICRSCDAVYIGKINIVESVIDIGDQ